MSTKELMDNLEQLIFSWWEEKFIDIDQLSASDNIIIPLREQMNLLLKSDRVLQRLEEAGVDNWEGYSDALKDSPA